MLKKIGKGIEIVLSILILVISAALMLLEQSKWWAYLFLLIAVGTGIYLLVSRNHSWKKRLIYIMILVFLVPAMYWGRGDLQVSYKGIFWREAMRCAFYNKVTNHKDGNLDATLAGADKNRKEKEWKAPDGYQYTKESVGSASIEWIKKDNGNHQKVLLFLHGGAYIQPLNNYNRSSCIQLAKQIGDVDIALLQYSLYPEAVFPKAEEEAVLAYKQILKDGYDASHVMVLGESAGGNLALGMCLYLRDEKIELPGAIAVQSPWADLSESGESYKTNLHKDPMFGIKKNGNPDYAGVPSNYAGDEDLKNPYLSPVFADYKDFPPMLIQAGGYELLLSDSETIAENAKKEGVDVTFHIYHGMYHSWQDNSFKESKQAEKEAMEFLDKKTDK